jgi:hypothetical protein
MADSSGRIEHGLLTTGTTFLTRGFIRDRPASQAGRSAGKTADDLQAGGQSQDGEYPRPCAAELLEPRRRGDRFGSASLRWASNFQLSRVRLGRYCLKTRPTAGRRKI